MSRRAPTASSAVRTVTEAVVCLALAVVVFRAFEVEGYVISTGSMAPGLYGYHKRVTCPNCAHGFARGVAFDDSGDPVRADESDPHAGAPAEVARCPNCGQGGISLAGVPDNQGDQLLVLKHAFDLRDPRRWEVVVFRHPDDARQAYVKRVVGLPGESVRVFGGDIYIDGRLARKSPAARRAVRLPVHDADRPPTGPRGLPHWSGRGVVGLAPAHRRQRAGRRRPDRCGRGGADVHAGPAAGRPRHARLADLPAPAELRRDAPHRRHAGAAAPRAAVPRAAADAGLRLGRGHPHALRHGRAAGRAGGRTADDGPRRRLAVGGGPAGGDDPSRPRSTTPTGTTAAGGGIRRSRSAT